MEKLDEGGFNRIFLITMLDGFQMIARIPYPVTEPKFYAIASEVATMAFLRANGLPVPKVYGYSPTSDNAAKTEYVFMEFIRGTKLTDVWM
jgi:aminoglycoside phosphotransferase (APT) family kinase protein